MALEAALKFCYLMLVTTCNRRVPLQYCLFRYCTVRFYSWPRRLTEQLTTVVTRSEEALVR